VTEYVWLNISFQLTFLMLKVRYDYKKFYHKKSRKFFLINAKNLAENSVPLTKKS